MIGRKFDDATVQADMKHWPFEVINDNTKPKIKVEYKGEVKTFFPEEVSITVYSYLIHIVIFVVSVVSSVFLEMLNHLNVTCS